MHAFKGLIAVVFLDRDQCWDQEHPNNIRYPVVLKIGGVVQAAFTPTIRSLSLLIKGIADQN